MTNANDDHQTPSIGFYAVCATIALLCAIEVVFLVLEYKNLVETNATTADYVLSFVYITVVAILVAMLLMKQAIGIWGSFIFFPSYVLAIAISALLDPEGFPKGLYVAINGLLYGGVLRFLGKEQVLCLFGLTAMTKAFGVISGALIVGGVFFLVAAYKGAVIAIVVSAILVFAATRKLVRAGFSK